MASTKQLGPSPVIKLYDTDGTVLASGTVETFETGTSNTKNSYTSSAGAGAATSFTLDSNGEAVRYFDTDLAYKLVIKDSSGSTVRTIDPYTPIPAPFELDNDLDVNGQSIVSSSAGDIAITPDTTGDIILDGQKWPQADGTNGQVLTTDGSAQLSWSTVSADLVSDTTPQLGGDLDTNSNNIQFDNFHGLRDDSDNEYLRLAKITNAVNYIQVRNSATGNAVDISAGGSDTNIDLNIDEKGSGNVVISGLSYPNSTGSTNQIILTDGAGELSFGDPSDVLTIANQSSMETATATDEFVPPGNAVYHPGMPKAWVVFQIDGTVDASYNCTSVADNGTGDWTITWSITMSSTDYAVLATPITTTAHAITAHMKAKTTTTTQINTYVTTALTDPSYGCCVMIMGDI